MRAAEKEQKSILRHRVNETKTRVSNPIRGLSKI